MCTRQGPGSLQRRLPRGPEAARSHLHIHEPGSAHVGPRGLPATDTYPGLRLVRGETHVATAQGQTWAPWGTGGLRWQFTSTFVMTQIPQTTFERPI